MGIAFLGNGLFVGLGRLGRLDLGDAVVERGHGAVLQDLGTATSWDVELLNG